MKKANFLLNPFERIAGWRALWLGLAAIVVAGMLGGLSGVIFDGAIDVHLSDGELSLWNYATMHLIDWAGVTLAMLLAAAIFYRGKFRVVDIAGTMAFSRVPMLGAALLALPFAPLGFDDFISLVALGSAFAIFSIWMIVLMWRGFSVSCNARGAKGAWVFIVALLVAEIAIGKLYVLLGWKQSLAEVLQRLPW